jgi:hypothetical protein
MDYLELLIVGIALGVMNVTGFVSIIYLLENHSLGPFTYHVTAGVFFICILISSVTLTAMSLNNILNEKEKANDLNNIKKKH